MMLPAWAQLVGDEPKYPRCPAAIAPITSHISKTSPPTRICTSEGRAAPALPKSCGRGTFLRLPRAWRIHVNAASNVRRIRHSAQPAVSRRSVSGAGVSCLLMARDGKTARREPAGQQAPTRQPVPRPDGDAAVPPLPTPDPDDPMSYTYTTDLAELARRANPAAMRLVVQQVRGSADGLCDGARVRRRTLHAGGDRRRGRRDEHGRSTPPARRRGVPATAHADHRPVRAALHG